MISALLNPTDSATPSSSSNRASGPQSPPSKRRITPSTITSPQRSAPIQSTPEAGTSRPSSMTPSSRADLTNLVNATNEAPIVSSRPTQIDEEEEEADVTMAEGAIGVDPDEAMEDDNKDDIIVEEVDDDEDDDDEDDDDDDDSSGDESDDSESSDIIAIDGPDGLPSGSAAAPNVKTEPGADESTEPNKDAEGAGEAVNELKPKKKKRARPRSPSEDEDLPPPPPMPTIRLEIALPTDEETLDWNFIETAANAGFEGVFNAWGEDPLAGEVTPLVAVDLNGTALDGEASATPAAAPDAAPAEPRPPGFSDEEWREMQEEARRLEAKYEEPKKKRVMTKKRKIEYDLSDPFIDDSDLGIDAPTHVARPKKEGFFVHQGALELMEGSPVKKAKAKTSRASGRAPKEQRKSLSEVLRERHGPDGSRASPILIGSDDEAAGPSYIPDRRSPSPEDAPEDRYPVDRTLYKAASKEDKYLPPFDEFPDEVAHRLRALRRESSKHVWDLMNKGKFPEHLKGPLQRAGVAAFHHDLLCVTDKETTDSGYERFTEKAFVSALCSVLPYNRLTLGKLVIKLCYTQYWRWMQMCEAEGLRQWKELLEPEIPIMLQQYEQAVAEHTSRQEEPELAEFDEDQNKAKSTDPKKLPTITQEMKDIFRQLVENTQEMVDINKRMEDWGQKFEGQSSELNMRKLLYNKIAKLYPEGWMTSLTLSRQYTNYKRLGQGSKSSGAAAADGTQQPPATQQ